MIEARQLQLPRLPREFYLGDSVVHWTLPVFNRSKGWLTQSFHQGFRELMLHTCIREGLLSPVYCLMPDHIHLIWMGTQFNSDQLTAMSFLRTYLEPMLHPHKFQSQAHDHVLSTEERKRNAFARLCSYISNNPSRAELVEESMDYMFRGAIVPGYPSMSTLGEGFWRKFWARYKTIKEPNAGSQKLPVRSTLGLSGNTNA